MGKQPGKSPIALFVYNRPVHTRRTVEALQKNDFAEQSNLVIFSDAPKSLKDAEAVNKVRDCIRHIDGFKSVTIIERETNFGLAHSIIDGVTRLCDECGRVVVLEDDIVTSPHFLRFMNDALDMYEHEDQVLHISGSTYPIEDMADETFFLRVPLCWGWATWHRAWRHFAKNSDVTSMFDEKMRANFNFNDSYHYWGQLEENAKGSINTWFVYWYATLFLRNGLALFPGRSLVKNIGMDGSGVHCGVSDVYEMQTSLTAIHLERIPIVESGEVVTRHERYFRSKCAPSSPPKLSLFGRFFRKTRSVMGRLALVIHSEGAEK
jgi:hypothetical protein